MERIRVDLQVFSLEMRPLRRSCRFGNAESPPLLIVFANGMFKAADP